MYEWSLIECDRLVSGSGGIRRARGLVLRIRVGCDRALVSGKGAYGSCGRRHALCCLVICFAYFRGEWVIDFDTIFRRHFLLFGVFEIHEFVFAVYQSSTRTRSKSLQYTCYLHLRACLFEHNP